MAAAESFDVICIECGLFMRSEQELKRHMQTVHESSSASSIINQSSTSNTSGAASLLMSPSSTASLSATASAPFVALPQLGELDGAACCRFLTELFKLIKPGQQHQPIFGESLFLNIPPFSHIANAALIELLRKHETPTASRSLANNSIPQFANSTDSPRAQLLIPSSIPNNVINTDERSCSPSEHLRNESGNNSRDQGIIKPISIPSTPDSVTSKPSEARITPLKSERRYTCEYCGKQFAQAPTLIAHRRIHTGEKPYKCHICNAAFKQVTHRNDHVNSHDPDYRPFICQECGRGFARKYSLSIHTLIHKGIYRFQCSYCDKKFRQSADKKKHELRHTRVK